MKFFIDNAGDTSVGIPGFTEMAILPNVGFEEEEWVTWCKSLLNELYNSETKGKVYTEEEWKNIGIETMAVRYLREIESK